MKKLVVTTMAVFLLDPNNQVVEAFRPTLVTSTPFIQQAMMQGKIKLATDQEIKPTATDDDFKKHYYAALQESKGSDSLRQEIAIKTFLEEFGLKTEALETDLSTEEKPEEKSKSKKA